MARSDWAALLTEPAAEYLACTELQRFGLSPYLPQLRKRYFSRGGKFVMRSYPLFPRYLFVNYSDAHHPHIRLARGINKLCPLLASLSGHPWRAPDKVIVGVKQAEAEGRYDQILHKGDVVAFRHGVLSTIRAVLADDAPPGITELLTPLFGGARVRIDQARLVRPI